MKNSIMEYRVDLDGEYEVVLNYRVIPEEPMEELYPGAPMQIEFMDGDILNSKNKYIKAPDNFSFSGLFDLFYKQIYEYTEYIIRIGGEDV